MQQTTKQGWATAAQGFPDQHHMLDWMTLCGETGKAHAWVTQLLATNGAGTEFIPDAIMEKALWDIYFAQRQALRLRGEQLLHFGYPYFLGGREDQAPRAMALFRWPLVLDPPRSNRQSWQLSTAGNATPIINSDWLAWAQALQPEVAWEETLRACFAEPGQAGRRLSELALLIAETPQWETVSTNPAISSFPTTTDLHARAGGGALVWAATLGLWSTVAAVTTEQLHWRVPLSPITAAPPVVGLDLLDPSQHTALQMAHHNRYLLVKGGGGTGKTHLLTHLLGQALLQQRSVLVVARHLGSLQRVQDQLDTFGLAHLCFTARGAAVEAPLLRGLLTAYDRKPPRYPEVDQASWRNEIARMDRLRQRLDEYYRASRRPVFGDHSWSDVLGHYLYAARHESKAMLASQLSSQAFAFRPREYQQVITAIRQTKPLFDRLSTLQHPLEDLNAAIFIHQERDESRAFIRQTADKLLALARPLHQRYVRRQSQYADELATHFDRQYRDLLNAWQKLRELWASSSEEVGEELLRSGDGTLKLYSLFSGRFRKAIQRREELIEGYRELRVKHEGRQLFSFEWLPEKSSGQLDQINDNLRQYRAGLEEWRGGLSENLQEELIRLNFKTAHPELSVSATIEPLEQELEQFIDEVNAVGLYQLPVRSKTLTLAKQQKNLEEIIERLERTIGGLQDFDDFYAWQRNWFSLPELSRKALTAILRVRPKDWESAFGSWYFNECLVQHYQPLATLASGSRRQYAEGYALASAQLPVVIRKAWESRRDAAARELRAESKTWPEQATPDFLASLFKRWAASVAQFLPIWLVTPAIAADLVDYFDQVLVIDAHALGVEESAWMHRAQQLLLFANHRQMTDAATLVRQCLRGDIPVATLRESHRPPLLPRLLSDELAVSFAQVEGRYDASAETNEVEAQAILRWLNQVEKMPNRTYPRVGVLVATAAQRNLVLQYFHTIKSKKQPGAELIQQLERNGLQVLVFQEAIGLKFDLVLMATVLGAVDAEGRLPGGIPAWLDPPELEAAFSSVQQALHVITSLPADELTAWLDWEDQPGARLLAGFLLAAEAQAERRFAMVQKLLVEYPDFSLPNQESPESLPREVAYRLGALLPGWRWEWKAPRPGNLPLLHFYSPQEKCVLLLVDDFIAQAPYTHYSWEWNHRQSLKNQGYRLLSIQSEAWWKTPAQEAVRLANAMQGGFAQEEE